jgi:hypothetical protein
MGSDQSASIDQFVRNSIVSKNTNQAVVNFETNSETIVTVKQSVKVRIKGENVTISNTTIGNNATLDMKMITELTSEINLEFINALKTGVKNDLDATLENGLGALANPFGSQASNIRSTVQNEVTNIIENEIEINNIKSFFTNLQVNQENELIIEATGFVNIDNLTLNNNYQLELVSQQIMSDTISAVLENEAVNDVLTEEVAYLEQRADGVNDVVDSIGGVIGKIFSGLFAPLIIIAVIISIVVVVFLVLKKKKSNPANSTQGIPQQAGPGYPGQQGPPGPPPGPFQDPGQSGQFGPPVSGPPIGVA